MHAIVAPAAIFLAMALVIVVAGTFLTRAGDAIAELTGLGRLLVGSIFLAAATSLPELLVDVNAVRLGFPDMAVGDLMGSSLFNLLILAVADLSFTSRGQMLSRAAAAHALSGTMSIALTALAALGIAVSSKFPDAMLGGVGFGSLVIAAGYVLGLRLAYYDQRVAARSPEAGQHSLPIGNMTLRRAIVQYLAAAAVIFAAAPFLAQAAGELADATGLGKTFIGTTLVALSTSLPELVATLAAVRMGAFDLALGNIFGSNSFNMVLLVPLDLFHTGSLLAAASPTHAVTGMCAIIVTSVAVMGQLYQVEKRTRFLEPDAVMMIGLILAALGLVYYLGE